MHEAEIVLRAVAQDQVAAAELAADRLDSRDITGIIRLDEAELGEKQQRRVEIGPVEGRDEMTLLLVPDPVGNDAFQTPGLAAPVLLAVGPAERAGDAGEPVAGGPAHHAGKGVDDLLLA